MPSQIPPATRIAGESALIRIRSMPGAMPPRSTPSTLTANGFGVVPWLVVHPVARIPACTDPAVTAVGQAERCVTTAAAPPGDDATAATGINNTSGATTAVNRLPGLFMVRTPP